MISQGIFKRLKTLGRKGRHEMSNEIAIDLDRFSFLDLEILENEIMQKLGKGWGSSTVSLEVDALRKLAEEFGIAFLQNSAVKETFTFVIVPPVSFLINAPKAMVVVPVAIVPNARFTSFVMPKL